MGVSMKAIQYIEKGRPEVVELPIRARRRPSFGQDLWCGDCPQWDIHIMDGIPMAGARWSIHTLGQPGHEAAGKVVELGRGVTEFTAVTG